MSALKHVLLITYYWPPAGGSGVQRWMYFAKYLKEFGCEVTVITVDPKFASYSSIDQSLLEHVKDIEVHKTKTFELIRLYSFLKSGNSKKSIPQGNVGGKKKSFLDKFSSYVRANYFIPDARVGWNPYVFTKAKELLTKQKFDLVITTGPPHSTHLVGLKLKEKFKIKWLADFRDPWTEVYYNDIFKRTKKNQKKDEKLELNVLQNADLVLTIGPSMAELLQGKIPDLKEKVRFVYNGFDDNLIGHEFYTEKNKKFTISYVGTLSSNYPYESLIKALSKIENPSSIILEFTGKIENEIIEEFKVKTKSEVIYNGVLPHLKSYGKMKSADLNLLLLPNQIFEKIMITGKVFEYFSTGNPILCIGSSKSDATKLIMQESKVNGSFEEFEIDSISNFLQEIISKKLKVNATESVFKYSKKTLSKEILEIFNELLK